MTAAMVKELRERTGAGIMDCKRALEETDGDMDKAADCCAQGVLPGRGEGRPRGTNEGLIATYIHHAGGIASGRAGRGQLRDGLRRPHRRVPDARAPWPCRSPAPRRSTCAVRIPAEIVERERAVYREQVQGKPETILEKIVDGQLEVLLAQVCLLEQPWIKDDSKKVGELVTEAIAKIGENIRVARFARFALGEDGTNSDGADAPGAA